MISDEALEVATLGEDEKDTMIDRVVNNPIIGNDERIKLNIRFTSPKV